MNAVWVTILVSIESVGRQALVVPAMPRCRPCHATGNIDSRQTAIVIIIRIFI